MGIIGFGKKIMKIDKVIFSSSELFSEFWNPVSEVFYTKLGIEPTLILIGDKEKTQVSEKYGKVINFKPLDLPLRLQVLWARFFFTKLFGPEEVLMIGDIDLFPLQKYWFIDQIKDISQNSWVHLAENRVSDSHGRPQSSWKTNDLYHGGSDLAAHYHISKGKNFNKFLELHDTFQESCQFIFDAKRYGLGFYDQSFNNDEWRFHCCCENLSTEKLRENLSTIDFHGFSYDIWKFAIHKECRYNLDTLKNGQYVDLHAPRPYETNKDKIQEILNIAWHENHIS